MAACALSTADEMREQTDAEHEQTADDDDSCSSRSASLAHSIFQLSATCPARHRVDVIAAAAPDAVLSSVSVQTIQQNCFRNILFNILIFTVRLRMSLHVVVVVF